MSPFLYKRLRARIAAEQARREAGESWLTLLGVAWRTVPAMLLVAVLALALFLSASFSAGTQSSSGDYSLLGNSDGGIDVVFAEQRTLSSDEVLGTIWEDDERETLK